MSEKKIHKSVKKKGDLRTIYLNWSIDYFNLQKVRKKNQIELPYDLDKLIYKFNWDLFAFVKKWEGKDIPKPNHIEDLVGNFLTELNRLLEPHNQGEISKSFDTTRKWATNFLIQLRASYPKERLSSAGFSDQYVKVSDSESVTRVKKTLLSEYIRALAKVIPKEWKSVGFNASRLSEVDKLVAQFYFEFLAFSPAYPFPKTTDDLKTLLVGFLTELKGFERQKKGKKLTSSLKGWCRRLLFDLEQIEADKNLGEASYSSQKLKSIDRVPENLEEKEWSIMTLKNEFDVTALINILRNDKTLDTIVNDSAKLEELYPDLHKALESNEELRKLFEATSYALGYIAEKKNIGNPNLATDNKKKSDAFAVEMGEHLERVRDEGFISTRDIADRFNELNIESYRGGKWSFVTVNNLINRRKALGLEGNEENTLSAE